MDMSQCCDGIAVLFLFSASACSLLCYLSGIGHIRVACAYKQSISGECASRCCLFCLLLPPWPACGFRVTVGCLVQTIAFVICLQVGFLCLSWLDILWLFSVPIHSFCFTGRTCFPVSL